MGTDIIKIAICDDEKVIIDRLRGYIEKYIKKAGLPYKIDIYQSGEEFAALEKAMSGYDIVFMDVNMKEMDGIKTAEDHLPNFIMEDLKLKNHFCIRKILSLTKIIWYIYTKL